MLQRKNSLLICMLFCCYVAHAQKFTVKANLAAVTANGFYSINITPQLSSYTTINYSDLRIVNDKHQFVPYIIVSKQPSFLEHNYNKLSITKNILNDSGQSVLVVTNEAHKKITSLALLIRNAAVTRRATISGSDDMNHWFTINENISFEKQTFAETEKYVQTINFPVSSYTFFKIVIDNQKNNPLNIIEAGSYTDTQHVEKDQYTINPLPVFSQTDSSDGNSYVKIRQRAAYHINKIALQIVSPAFYQRNIDIINTSGIAGFVIKSNNISDLDLPAFNDTRWIIKIYNGDNPPLKINAVMLKQESQTVIAYLPAGKDYQLLMHDASAVKPVYDLQEFEDSIPVVIPQLKIVSFEIIHSVSSAENKFIFSSAWLWPLIIIVLATLAFVTYRLTKEINSTTN